MALALAEADAAAACGDVPVGAVILDPQGAVLSVGRNRREVDGDATAHAEVEAIRAASRSIGHWRLIDCTLVCTLEPCVMCAGALVNARIRRLVYGADDPKAGAIRSIYQIVEDTRLNHRLEVIRGVDAEPCAARLKAFFARLRAQGQKLLTLAAPSWVLRRRRSRHVSGRSALLVVACLKHVSIRDQLRRLRHAKLHRLGQPLLKLVISNEMALGHPPHQSLQIAHM